MLRVSAARLWSRHPLCHRSIFSRPRASPDKSTPGLFGLAGLHRPADWSQIASTCIDDCLRHADTIRHHPVTRDASLLQIFDDLSDRLCSVLDVAELCRNVHPQQEFAHAAHDAFADISLVLQELNADHALYEPLRKLHEENAGVRGGFLSPEDVAMLKSLKHDFERGGITLNPANKRRLLALQRKVDEVSTRFVSAPREPPLLDIPDEKLRHLPRNVRQHIRKSPKPWHSRVPIDATMAQVLLKWIPDSRVREQVYRTLHEGKGVGGGVGLLDDLLQSRRDVAGLLGHNSYAKLLFSDRLASSPEEVLEFLEKLSKALQEKAQRERGAIEIEKMRLEPHVVENGRVSVQGWDRSFYIGRLKAQNFDLSSAQIANYMPLSSCLNALADIVKNVFGVKLVNVQPEEGELWHEDVQKVKLVDNNGQGLGFIFFDLYPRDGKFSHAAHFSIQCGRQPASQAVYQIPSVALVCNFGKISSAGSRLLTISEYETLFHEFGHSLHSLLSRTKYQHLSGTRVATDLVEVPSHLFEHFAWDPRVISRFARHHVTGDPMPTGLLRSLCASRKGFVATDVQMQILFSAMDLKFHGPQPPVGTTTTAFETLQNNFTAYPHDEGVSVPSSFHHFVGYGAGYYSYVFARILSAQIWGSMFQENPFSQVGGDRLRYGLLVHGGSCEPSVLVRNLLDHDVSCNPFLQSIGIDVRHADPNMRLPLTTSKR